MEANIVFVELGIGDGMDAAIETALNQSAQGAIDKSLAYLPNTHKPNEWDVIIRRLIHGSFKHVINEQLIENIHTASLKITAPSRALLRDRTFSKFRQAVSVAAESIAQRDASVVARIESEIALNPKSAYLVIRGQVHQRSIERLLNMRKILFDGSYHPREPWFIGAYYEVVSKRAAEEWIAKKDWLMAIADGLDIASYWKQGRRRQQADVSSNWFLLNDQSESELRRFIQTNCKGFVL